MPQENKKVVQTVLTKNEYAALAATLSRKNLSIQDGLHQAALKLIEEENQLDKQDSFFTMPRAKGSRAGGDLSSNHDKYLYTRKLKKNL